jgi:TolB-like protein
LNKDRTYTETKSLFQQEENLSVLDVSDSTIAVFPLIYQGTDTTYVPLSRGFSEMVSIDLAKVKQLKILERVRIQAVLDEIKFSQTSLVDQSTAPRAGKILKAGTIVSGDYDVTKNGYFRINLGSWDSQTSMRKSWVNKSGGLDDFFRLQKEVVFAFLQANGIELTKTEMEEISFIPTQNLQAFLLYSRGLVQEDAGNYKQAETYFNDAISNDPQFNAAKNKAEVNQKLSTSGGTKEQVVTVLQSADKVTLSESNQLVNNRASSVGNNITSSFTQGIDNRNPAAEESLLGRIVLPPPPPPPPEGPVLR